MTLSSSEPANATPPNTVTVAAGATLATFPIATRAQTGDLRLTITGTGGGQTRTALLRLTPAAAVVAAFTVVGERGDNLCLIKNAGGDLDCRLFATSAPANATFVWTFSMVGGVSPALEHDSTDPATKPEDGCGFLAQDGTTRLVDSNGDRYVQMTVVLRYLVGGGTLSSPQTKVLNIYTQGYCGY